MTDRWVSTKKWHCTYCDIWINDDAPSRMQHETGNRHIGNKERALRDIYKTGERRKKEKDEEARDMARINKAAAQAHAQDLGIAPPCPPPVVKPASKFAGYTTAADLGIEDPDAVKEAAEEEEDHKDEGRAGEWEVVAPPPPPTGSSTNAEASSSARPVPGGVFSKLATRRDEDDLEESNQFTFKKFEKVAYHSYGAGEDDDLGEIKVKVKEVDLQARKRKQEELEEDEKRSREKLVFKPVAWGSRLDEPEEDDEDDEDEDERETSRAGPALASAAEEMKPQVFSEVEEVKPAVVVPPPAPMFKKRRAAPSGAGRKPKA